MWTAVRPLAIGNVARTHELCSRLEFDPPAKSIPFAIEATTRVCFPRVPEARTSAPRSEWIPSDRRPPRRRVEHRWREPDQLQRPVRAARAAQPESGDHGGIEYAARSTSLPGGGRARARDSGTQCRAHNEGSRHHLRRASTLRHGLDAYRDLDTDSSASSASPVPPVPSRTDSREADRLVAQ